MPMFRSATTHVRANRHDSEGQQQRGKGDNRRQSKDHAIEKRGIQSSLKNILIMSATSCSEPPQPTRLGP